MIPDKKSNILPVIYIDRSAASLASGMDSSESVIHKWLKNNNIQAEVKYTGSLGAFSLNPVICIKLPGRPRLFFGPVQDYQVENLLEAVFSLQIPNDLLIGQLSGETAHPWDGIGDLNNHPFFREQERRSMGLVVDVDESYITLQRKNGQPFNLIKNKVYIEREVYARLKSKDTKEEVDVHVGSEFFAMIDGKKEKFIVTDITIDQVFYQDKKGNINFIFWKQ